MATPSSVKSFLVRAMSHTVALITGLTLIVSGLIFPLNPASAADLRQFDAGRIFDDVVFFDGSALNASQVQAFLNQRGGSCTHSLCLRNYRQTTPTMAAQFDGNGRQICSVYQGAPNETAAEIIAKIGRACNISQKVLLVLLQKEQSLVTRTNTTESHLRAATGFACYDNGQPCVAAEAGFFRQVWSAARQFQYYGTGWATYYPVGRWSNILYQANMPSCGTKSVFISNRATAALYYYTPYTPNAAALAAGYGLGDACSAYGNRNMYQFFVDWFGSTRAAAPGGFLESASISRVNGQLGLTVSGWSYDPADPALSNDVHIYVTNPAGQTSISGATANLQRDDVNRALGISGAHGYSSTVPVSTPGNYRVCVYAIVATQFSAGNRLIRCTNVTS